MKEKDTIKTHKKSRNTTIEDCLSHPTIIDDFISRSINPQDRSFTFNSIIFGNKHNKKETIQDLSPTKNHPIEPKIKVNCNSNEKVKVNRILRENQIPINKTINLNLNLNLRLNIKMIPATKVKFSLKSDRGINNSSSSSFISNNSSLLKVNNLRKSFNNCSLVENKSFINKIANLKNNAISKNIGKPVNIMVNQSKVQVRPVKNILANNKNKENMKAIDLKVLKNPHTKEKIMSEVKKNPTVTNVSLNRFKNPLQIKILPLGKIFK